ncbi:zf-HC2 domain-containing protein [Marinicrinis sediminis]|uniref:Anti-sigma-W factor RsiW n=1 Tax=Marinicrinis sediminis TaxID=1652465 RepID=A0ABW5RAH6_9BACL
MKCEDEVLDLIQRELDDDLDADEREQLHAHLQTCPACMDMYERYQQLNDELSVLPKIVPPYSIVDAIMPQLEQLQQEQSIDEGHLADAGKQAGDEGKEKVAWFSKWRDSVSYRALGGVMAAGLILALIVNGMLPSQDESADHTAFDSADMAVSNDQASSDMDAAKETSSDDASIMEKGQDHMGDDPTSLLEKEVLEPDTADEQGTSVQKKRDSQPSMEGDEQTSADSSETFYSGNADHDDAAGASEYEAESIKSAPSGGQLEADESTSSNSERMVPKFMEDAEQGSSVEGDTNAERPFHTRDQYGNETEEADVHGMQAMDAPSPYVSSPSGEWQAWVEQVEDGTQVVVERTQEPDTFRSPIVHDGVVTDLVWIDAQLLQYAVSLPDKETKYQLDMESKSVTEIKQASK